MHYTRVSMAKPNSVVVFVVIFLLANSMKEGYSIISCPEIEREALLSFKQPLDDVFNILSSWNNRSNCCKWKGVVCSNVTGNVHQLHLKADIGSWYPHPILWGEINPSLLNLKHLKYLDLSGNGFIGRIPSFMGSLTSLEYLNLSDAGFYGKIPPTIGNLSRLHTLSLGNGFKSWGMEVDGNNYADESEFYVANGGLDVDSLEWLRGLSQLEHLNMNLVNLTKAASHWMQVINALPSLVELRLSFCGLNFISYPSSADVNITSLAILDLSYNNKFESFPIPNWIFKQSNLVFLDLSVNKFEGPIPAITNITKLRYINLSLNYYLNSTIPDWLYSCKDLEFFSMSYNSLQGSISNAIGNLTSLTNLDLSANLLSGEIPRGILELCKLQSLDLSNNTLHGEIPDMLGQMSDHMLRYLRLRDNRLTGNLPMSVGRLSNLEVVDVENNTMSGVLTESHFVNLTKLGLFIASGNHLTLKLSPNWNPPFKLYTLRLGSWNLGASSGIFSWLDTQKSTLNELDLSNTGISGSVPTWFWQIPFLNLNNNQLSGNIPSIIGSHIYLSSNQFSGPLPLVGDELRELNLSNNSFSGGISHFLCDMITHTHAWYLDLRGNQLTGEIPDCWMTWNYLTVVDLGNNNFSGPSPNSLGTLTEMKSLNLCDNNLSGQIPVSISNCKRLVKMDLSGNNLVGDIPTWIGGSLAELRFLILRSNKLGGTIPTSICHLKSLQILDLSNNSFYGRIPSCVNNLTAMTVNGKLTSVLEHAFNSSRSFLESASVATKGRKAYYDTILGLVNNIDLSDNNLSGEIPKELTSLVELVSLNLSGNQLTGSIPESIGDMKKLESLDLSRNALSGEMPNSFRAMSFLSYLNLSFNNLRGRIPESTQLKGMYASSFVGNHLCGPPLVEKCPGEDAAGNNEDNKDDKAEVEWLYVVLSLGYAVGFSVCCTTLVLKKSWRMAYFGLVDRIWDKLYVYYHIKVTKLRRQRTQPS